jgi:hypothetical protein
MRADEFDIPAGQPLRKVRDFLHLVSQRGFDAEEITKHFGSDISDELAAKGLIEPYVSEHRHPSGTHRGYYDAVFQLSPLGFRLANVKLIKRITRAEAEVIVADFLKRVRAVNARHDLLWRVRRVQVFGSYITDAPELGDIDLVVELEQNRDALQEIDEWTAAVLARARASGRVLSSYDQMLDYPRREVLLLLKARNRYIAFHREALFEGLKTPARVLYELAT